MPIRSIATAALLGALVAAPAHGRENSACPVEFRDEVPHRVASAIRLDLSPEVSREVVDEVVHLWGACEGYGDDFPRLVLRDEADRTIRVRFEQKRPGEGHCGTLFRGEIVLYATARDRAGRLRSCGAVEENLAHEVGHVLGLGDAPARRGCRQRIMSPLHTGHSKNLAGRAPHPEECRAVAGHWWTRDELEIEERRALARIGAARAAVTEPPEASLP